MRRLSAPALLACWAAVATTLVAGPREEVILAAMRLGEALNYSWLTTVTDDARTYSIAGQTLRGDLTHVLQPLVNHLRRPLGLASTETEVEFYFRGNQACVVGTPHGWLTPDEIRALRPTPVGPASASSGGVSLSSPGGAALPLPPAAAGPRAYSNLQLTISHPHEDLGMLVAGNTDLEIGDGMASGALSEVTARLLLVHEGQDQLEPVTASGRFRMWMENGVVARYEIRLEGVVRVRSAGTARDIPVRQTTDTVVRHIGTTRFVVPDAVRARLVGTGAAAP